MSVLARPTEEQALRAAASVYLEAKIRIETEKAIAAASANHSPERAA